MEANHEVPRRSWPPISGKLSSWIVLAALVGVALVFGIARLSGTSLLTRSSAQSAPNTVRVYSSLERLKAGQTGAHVSLSDIPSRPGVIGIGSLSGLRGEIAIVRGTTWLSYALPDGSMQLGGSGARNESATFLAFADVPDWDSQTFEAPVRYEALADELQRSASEAGLDTSKPIPLIVDGEFSAIELNVVNGPALGNELPTDERLKKTALRASIPSAKGSIVGFLAARGGERLIHPGQRFHLHVVLPVSGHVGHLDSVTVAPGAVLRLPRADR